MAIKTVRDLFYKFCQCYPAMPRCIVPEKFLALADSRTVVESECRVGIEIEAEGWFGIGEPENDYLSLWTPKEENSLRNNGIELVSPPLKNKHIVPALCLLDKINEKGNLKYNDLTGLHIHLDMQKATAQQVANLSMIYVVFEMALFDFSGKRSSSIYCNPVQSCFSGIVDILDLDLEIAINNAKKYMAFNYAPLITYGTVEFRHAAGTPDTKFILNWINLLLRMWNYAHEIPFEDLKSRVLSTHTEEDYQRLTQEIFKDQTELLVNSTLWNSVFHGVSFVKECFSHTNRLSIPDVTVVKRGRAINRNPKGRYVVENNQLVFKPERAVNPRRW